PVSDLHDESVEVDDRVERLQRPRLPRQHLIKDLVSDLADRLVAQLAADDDRQVMLDVADGHAAGVEAYDHLVQPAQATLALGHQPGRERALAVPGHAQGHAPGFSEDRLLAAAVAV